MVPLLAYTTWTHVKALIDTTLVKTIYYVTGNGGTNNFDLFVQDDTRWFTCNVAGTSGGSSGQVFNDTYKPNAISVTSYEEALGKVPHFPGAWRIDWAYFEAFVTRSGALVYYITVNDTLNQYYVFGFEGDRIWLTYVTGTGGGDSGTDFETNYKPSAIAVSNLPNAVGSVAQPRTGFAPQAGYKLNLVGGLDGTNARILLTDTGGRQITVGTGVDGGAAVRTFLTDTTGRLEVRQTLQPLVGTGEDVTLYGTLTTSATTANQVVLTYTVTAGKTLYLYGFSLNKVASAAGAISAAGGRMALQVAGADVDQQAAPASATAVIDWSRQYASAFAQATAGQVIRLVVTPSANTSTVWAGRILGVEV